MKSTVNIIREVSIEHGRMMVDGAVLANSGFTSLKETLGSWYKHLHMEYPKFHKMDALCQLAILGAETLLDGTAVTTRFAKEDIAIVLSNASSSLNTDSKYHQTISTASAYFPSPAMFVYTLPSIMCGEIAIRHGIQGENNFLISGSLDRKLLIEAVATLFLQTHTKACIAGWVQVDGDSYQLWMILAIKSI